MGLFSRRDWNIVAVIYESKDRMRLNANREQGGSAVKAKNNAAAYAATVCWGVFDQQGRLLDRGLGPAAKKLPAADAQRILDGLPTHRKVLELLRDLEQGKKGAAAVFTPPAAPGATRPAIE